MQCPRCESSMLDERERDGVNIDVCRGCRGVWLDRGELEKLVARASRELEAYERGYERGGRPDDDDDRRGPHRKRRWFESLGDIFD